MFLDKALTDDPVKRCLQLAVGESVFGLLEGLLQHLDPGIGLILGAGGALQVDAGHGSVLHGLAGAAPFDDCQLVGGFRLAKLGLDGISLNPEIMGVEACNHLSFAHPVPLLDQDLLQGARYTKREAGTLVRLDLAAELQAVEALAVGELHGIHRPRRFDHFGGRVGAAAGEQASQYEYREARRGKQGVLHGENPVIQV